LAAASTDASACGTCLLMGAVSRQLRGSTKAWPWYAVSITASVRASLNLKIPEHPELSAMTSRTFELLGKFDAG
jgi:hypothetical protein